MKLLKKYNYIPKFILFILILNIIITIINLLIPLKNTINQIITLTSLSLFILITGINKGKITTEKAYKKGLIQGLIYVLVLYILGCFTLSFTIPLKKLILYIIVIIISILGYIIGINKKSSK